jgi:eukaryotic-like serine/threonine-protein kinase
MNLWTEYEGRTIDGAYPLTKLIRPEGRSAFFSTPNGTGTPTVIRLIESHFDGEDILVRWRGMEALNHPNLVKLKKFGHVMVDETPLVYAVMETVDGNLAEILRERPLSVDETREVATSLLAALEALHGSGFVHEHVEPANVMAVGETIKLRSDCIRETLEGEEGAALKRKDVRDYGLVLAEALTQRKMVDRMLPGPFDEIVRKGMSGEWGLAQIGVALKGTGAVSAADFRSAAASPMVRPAAAPPIARAADVAPVVAPVERRVEANPVPPPSVSRRIRVPVDDARGRIGPRGIAYLVGTVLILLLGWFFVHKKSVDSSAATPVTAPVTRQDGPAAKSVSNSSSIPVRKTSAAVPVAAGAAVGGSGKWRVIAFTYNQEDQAQHKAAEIAQSHPDLNPSVFTPSGHAPFLVALGGPMSKQDAFALSGKAKREGLPKDVYAQNYRSGGN